MTGRTRGARIATLPEHDPFIFFFWCC